MPSTQPSVEIAVQPPHTVGVDRQLDPPVIARTRDPQILEDYLNGDKHFFATVTLYAVSNMDNYSAALRGTWSVSAQLVSESSSSSAGGSSSRSGNHQWLYFIFNTVSVTMEGMFAFNVDISALSLSSPNRAGMAQIIGGRATRPFNVLAHPPRSERPSMSSMIRNLT